MFWQDCDYLGKFSIFADNNWLAAFTLVKLTQYSCPLIPQYPLCPAILSVLSLR